MELVAKFVLVSVLDAVLIVILLLSLLKRKDIKKLFARWEARAKEETRRKQEEAECLEREARDWQEQNTRRLCTFQQYPISFYIRERDGRKNPFETILIEAALKNGLPALPFPESKGKQLADGMMDSLKDGQLVVVGTSWTTSHVLFQHGECTKRHCDCRVIFKPTNSPACLIAAIYREGFVEYSGENSIAEWVIKDLLPAADADVISKNQKTE